MSGALAVHIAQESHFHRGWNRKSTPSSTGRPRRARRGNERAAHLSRRCRPLARPRAAAAPAASSAADNATTCQTVRASPAIKSS